MGIYSIIGKLKQEIKDNFKEKRIEKAELNQIYREELKKAKIHEVKKKARAKKTYIILQAREDAKGGKITRSIREYKEFLKKKRKAESKRVEKNKPDSLPPMFR